MNHAMWIAVAAVVIGALVRAIKSDGAKVALANLGLRPIPTRALPWVALVFGAASATLEAKVAGSGWEEAAAKGVLAAGAAVFGHELLSGLPGFKKIVGAMLFVSLASSFSACTPQGRWHAANVVLDVLQCVIANEAKPDAEVVALCAGENVSPDDVRKILASHRASLASARAGVCAPDGGAR